MMANCKKQRPLQGVTPSLTCLGHKVTLIARRRDNVDVDDRRSGGATVKGRDR